MDKDKSRKLKIHLMFGGGLTLVFLISVISRVASGERLLQASWNSLREIRPIEWGMILLFWYWTAYQKAQNEWPSSPVTTLGLSDKR